MITVLLLLALAAFFLTLGVALNKVAVWVPVLILCIIELLRVVPLGR